jgi:hypothetical protein
MERLTYDLGETFKRRIPWAIDGIRIVYFDGDPSKSYVQLGHDIAKRWDLYNVIALNLGFRSTEWYIVNTEAQKGRTLKILVGTVEELSALTIEETAPVKAMSLRTGTITVGTSVVQGPDIEASPGKAVVVEAEEGNTGTIYVGHDSSVTTSTGFPLSPGEAVALNIDNISRLYLISDVADQKVRYIVEVRT